MHGTKAELVNSAKYELFCSSSASEPPSPPTQYALKHLKGANYQAAIRKIAWAANNVLKPAGKGWKEEGQLLLVHRMNDDPVPSSLLK